MPAWASIADRICALLGQVYVKNIELFRVEAEKRGIAVEQLAAAAIAEMIRSDVMWLRPK